LDDAQAKGSRTYTATGKGKPYETEFGGWGAVRWDMRKVKCLTPLVDFLKLSRKYVLKKRFLSLGLRHDDILCENTLLAISGRGLKVCYSGEVATPSNSTEPRTYVIVFISVVNRPMNELKHVCPNPCLSRQVLPSAPWPPA
jgi:hypothetical protein